MTPRSHRPHHCYYYYQQQQQQQQQQPCCSSFSAAATVVSAAATVIVSAAASWLLEGSKPFTLVFNVFQIGDFKMPFKVSHHPVCTYTGQVRRTVRLSDCAGYPDPTIEVFDAAGCACRLCDSDFTSCENLNGWRPGIFFTHCFTDHFPPEKEKTTTNKKQKRFINTPDTNFVHMYLFIPYWCRLTRMWVYVCDRKVDEWKV